MQAISRLPNLKRLRLRFEAYGDAQSQTRYANEAFTALDNGSISSLVRVDNNDRRDTSTIEIRNCTDMGVQI